MLMTDLTRRELVRAGATGAVLLGSGGLLGSLGSDAARAALTRDLTAGAKRGGTLRVGIAGGSPTDDFDMAHINGPSATVRAQAFYETVTFLDGQFRLHNDFLADEFKPNATADVWTVRLKQGVEFHNGKTATADDLLFSIRRLLNPKSGATAAGQLTAIDLKRTRKLDNRTVRFVLKSPQSFFDYLLSDIVYLVPVGYDPKKPVSTGPWRFKSFQPARQTVLDAVRELSRDAGVRRPARHDGAPGRYGTRERAASQGQVDVINQVPYPNVTQLKGQSGIPGRDLSDGRLEPDHHAGRRRSVQRRARAPGDPARHEPKAGDRDGPLRAGRAGGRHVRPLRPVVQCGLQARSGHREGEESAQAGRTNEPEARAGHLADRGRHRRGQSGPRAEREGRGDRHHGAKGRSRHVLLPIRQVAVRDRLLGRPAVPRRRLDRRRPRRERRQHDALQRPCLQQALRTGVRTLDKNKRAEIVHAMQKIQYDRGGYIIWSFQNSVDAYSTKVGGIQPIDKTAWGLDRCQLHKLYFK